MTLRQQKMTQYIVLTSGRSGSNYLIDQLNRHPGVYNYGEVLGEWTLPRKTIGKLLRMGMSYNSYLELFLKSRLVYACVSTYSFLHRLVTLRDPHYIPWRKLSAVGIKDFGINFKDLDIDDFLRTHPDIRVINLYRSNALRRFLSVKMLQQSGVVADEGQLNGAKAPNVKRKVFIDLNTFEQDMHRIEEVVQAQMEMIEGVSEERLLNICFEDLMASEDSKADYAKQVFEFLGVETLPVKSTHKRLSAERLQDMIENYDEVYRYCKGTRFEAYFDK